MNHKIFIATLIETTGTDTFVTTHSGKTAEEVAKSVINHLEMENEDRDLGIQIDWGVILKEITGENEQRGPYEIPVDNGDTCFQLACSINQIRNLKSSIPVTFHFQNADGDAELYRRNSVTIQMDTVPMKGEVVYTSEEQAEAVIDSILQSENDIRKWRNLIVTFREDRGPFMSIQGFWKVADRWHEATDGTVHLLMESGDKESSEDIKINKALIKSLKDNFDKGILWY